MSVGITRRRGVINRHHTTASAPTMVFGTPANNASLTTKTVAPAVPAGVASGSLLVAAVIVASDLAVTVAGPSGWTVGKSYSWVDSLFGANVTMYLFYKYAGGADTGTYTFTATTTSGFTFVVLDAVAIRVPGGPTSGNPFIDPEKENSAGGGGTSLTVPGFTPNNDHALLLGVFFADDASTLGVPSGWTVDGTFHDSGANTDMSFCHLTQTNSKSTGSLVFTSTNNVPLGVLIGTIRPPG